MKNLIPSHIKSLIPYKSARKISNNGKIFLNANELPFDINFKLDCLKLNRYPDFQPKKLINNYSLYSKVESSNIIVTRGIDESIELLIKTFCESKKDKVLFFPPTYDMYKVSSSILNINSISINSLSNFQLNYFKIIKKLKDVKLIFICHPNNPTGNIINIDFILKLLNSISLNTLIIIDEAYIDFCEQYSTVKYLKQYSNLVVLRTLSKAFGLAGIRCGFLLANIKIIKFLYKVIAPYPIATPVSKIAEILLNNENIQLMKRNVSQLILNKKWLLNKLKKFSYIQKVFNSDVNFILFKSNLSEELFSFFIKNGVILRDQSDKIFLKNCLRVTVGTIKECKIINNLLIDFENSKIFK